MQSVVFGSKRYIPFSWWDCCLWLTTTGEGRTTTTIDEEPLVSDRFDSNYG